MSVPTSVEELLQLIRKSGMVDETKLNGYVHRRTSGRGLPEDPRAACDAMIADGLITEFQGEQYMLGKWRGFTVGKYKLLERVGVGGMGQVFLCEHMFMNRRVAVKVLPPSKADQPAALGRFYREARAAGGLNHPNIVKTHDIDQDGNLHFIVMEYVDGSNLLDIVKKFGPMDIGRACHYIAQICEGLNYAYMSGIIHRDIKPGNFLVDRKGVCKLLDMGLARFYHDQTDMLTVKYDDKIVLGTADYVAPEQVANSHAVDVRADIYALGASFYFLLAGHPPFPTGTVSQKLLWHRTKDPTPISSVRPEVTEALAAIVSKMMQKDPNSRYQTPEEILFALKPFVPNSVPLPAEAEMPKLSLAAQPSESDLALPAGPQSVSMSKMRSEIESVRAELGLGNGKAPFAAAASAVATVDTPEPVRLDPKQSHSRLIAASELRATQARSGPPPIQPFAPTPSSSFPGTGSIPAKASSTVALMPGQPPTLPGGLQTPSPFQSKASLGKFPDVVARLANQQPAFDRTKLVYGLVGAAVVLVLGMAVYKFGFSKQTTPVAPQQETTEQP
jgi:serine/threonine protein kinase